MAYPKPLSEKTLTRLYNESGLTATQQDFLHTFFLAAVNLYGAVPLADLWEIYKDLSQNTTLTTPSLHKKDLAAFSSIARREVQPYFIYEQDELYQAKKDNPSKSIDRILVAKEIIHGFVDRWRAPFYRLTDTQDDKPYYVPDDFLSYAEVKTSPEETKLRLFLNNLTADAEELLDKAGRRKKSDHVGKRLSGFDFLSGIEKKDLKETFGSIAGGSAYKFGLFFHKKTKEWTTGSPSKPVILTEDQAIETAGTVCDHLIEGAEILSNTGDLNTEERDGLIADGTVGDYVFQKDWDDQSVSAAAAIIPGYPEFRKKRLPILLRTSSAV